jgi:hypothetical protein
VITAHLFNRLSTEPADRRCSISCHLLGSAGPIVFCDAAMVHRDRPPGFPRPALTEIDHTTWIPRGATTGLRDDPNRPTGAVAPALWGTPIPAFYCGACGTAHAGTMDRR